MKKFLVLFPIILVGYLFMLISRNVAINLVNQEIKSGTIQYGPIPNTISEYYDFSGVEKSYKNDLNLSLSQIYTKIEFEKFILDNIDSPFKDNAKIIIKEILLVAEEYQLDPFWLVSIALVESKFELNATSSKNAKGLMQIRPDTAAHLLKMLKKESTPEAVELSFRDYKINLDLAGFYLKKLLQNFRLNYQLATIAYNVGPNKLKSMINSNHPLSDNNYLRKVNKAYSNISKDFSLISSIKLEAVSKTGQFAQN